MTILFETMDGLREFKDMTCLDEPNLRTGLVIVRGGDAVRAARYYRFNGRMDGKAPIFEETDKP